MDVPAGEILQYARIYLNDSPGNQWNDEVLLPYLRLAWDELQIELQIRDIQVVDEVTADTVVGKDITELPPPADLITPFFISEKSIDEPVTSYMRMRQRSWEGNRDSGDILGNWTWRNGLFHFPSHNTDRAIQIGYLKSLIDIADENQIIALANCRIVLSKRTAALAARYGNSNPSRADILDVESAYAMEKLTGIQIKTKQSTMGRRRRAWGSTRRALSSFT